MSPLILTKTMPLRQRALTLILINVLLLSALHTELAAAQLDAEQALVEAAELLQAFTANDADAIPTELLQRARGIAIIPKVFRGGFILGGRRGRGILVVRDDNGNWSNPAFVTLTGGSIGWQIGAESSDIVLVFANDNAVKHISHGKFTLGGDATAIAGPLGRHASIALTFRAEVYGYVKSRGLYAGAAFHGARLDIDETAGEAFYGRGSRARPLGPQNYATPRSARRFLLSVEQAAATPQFGRRVPDSNANDAAVTFPLADGDGA